MPPIFIDKITHHHSNKSNRIHTRNIKLHSNKDNNNINKNNLIIIIQDKFTPPMPRCQINTIIQCNSLSTNILLGQDPRPMLITLNHSLK